jgi:hypothetical protein
MKQNIISARIFWLIRFADNEEPARSVCFELQSVEDQDGSHRISFACSNAAGEFHMEMMAPGKYWLVAGDEFTKRELKSKSTLYFARCAGAR